MPKPNVTTLTVGLAQMAPIWLQRDATLLKVNDWITQAARKGCDLVAFGEALVPGYPFWVERTDGARFDSDLQKDLYAHYLMEAIDIEAGDLDIVCKTAAQHKIAVYLGVMERASNRGGHSLYCAMVYIDGDGRIGSVHRKLMPTHEERLVWAIGDGHGLRTHKLGAFTVGGLNCWENWMPLARAALQGQGEDLHVAIWPGSLRNTQDITRFMALEGRSFVMSVASIMRATDIPVGLPHRELLLETASEVMANGGSCLADPSGNWVLEPVCDCEVLLVAEIDQLNVLRERQSFDPAGHYSRPDVLRLKVKSGRQSTVKIDD